MCSLVKSTNLSAKLILAEEKEGNKKFSVDINELAFLLLVHILYPDVNDDGVMYVITFWVKYTLGLSVIVE